MTYTRQEIYDAARRMLPDLEPPLRGEIEALLAQAEQGEETHLEILERLTVEETHRERLRALLRGWELPPLSLYEPSPGLPGVPASVRYICPVEGCDFAWWPQQKGERPPRCPHHNVDLREAPPAAQKGGR